MKKHLAVYCWLLIAACMPASAGECMQDPSGAVVCGTGDCARDQYGNVFCARRGGGALTDPYGGVRCGVGYCARNEWGEVKCSRVPGGGAAVDSNGNVKCFDGCEDGSAQRCEAARWASN